MSGDDPLGAAASRAAIERLGREGLLDARARAEALEALAGAASWWRPLSRLLAVFGTALVLAGVIYFFAANWAGLGRFEKLGLAGLLLAFALGLALAWDLDSWRGRLALLSATVLTGATLAVFGQVYQTGADAWQLFATWALLTLPWMLLARFAAHVIVWLVVLETAIATFWEQELHPDLLDFPSGLFLTLALVNLGALGLLSWLPPLGESWAHRPWVRPLLLAASLAALCLPTCVLIAAPDEVTWPAFPAALLALALVGLSWWWHRLREPDLLALALTALAAASILLTAIGKPLFELSDEWPMFILFGLIVSGVVGGVAVLLRREQLAIRRRPS